MPDPYSADYTGTSIPVEGRGAFRAQDDKAQARQQDAYMARDVVAGEYARVMRGGGQRARKNTRK